MDSMLEGNSLLEGGEALGQVTREAMDAPVLEAFKASSSGALSNLV